MPSKATVICKPSLLGGWTTPAVACDSTLTDGQNGWKQSQRPADPASLSTDGVGPSSLLAKQSPAISLSFRCSFTKQGQLPCAFLCSFFFWDETLCLNADQVIIETQHPREKKMKKAAECEGRDQVNSKRWWKYNDTVRVVNKSRRNELLY